MAYLFHLAKHANLVGLAFGGGESLKDRRETGLVKAFVSKKVVDTSWGDIDDPE
jgi:hypothetical protein